MKRFAYLSAALVFVLGATLVGCARGTDTAKAEPQTIVFGDASWDSITVHNRIAAFILEHGYGGYKAEYVPGDTLPIANGLIQGDVDVMMESWHSNWPEVYEKGIKAGTLVDLGQNMPDAPQGWWIPRYLVEGPNAPAPDLKSVADLSKYKNLFPDPEDPSKGILYTGAAGWSATAISEDIFKKYGLAPYFNQGLPGSGTALAATLVGAYQRHVGWVGYYWAPTPILGRLDMIRLKGSEFPAALVDILVNSKLVKRAPEVIEFLKRYKTSVADNNEFLAQMEDHKWDAQQTALWFLKNKEDVWTKWVSADIAKKVRAALS